MIFRTLTVLLTGIVLGCTLVQPPQARNDVRDIVVDEAMAQLERPYRYDGTDPTGFDNGGLVYYVFSRAGIDVPQTAAEQHASGRRNGGGGLRRGDLLFYMIEERGRQELHVGIFVGKERMVHIQKDGRVELTVINAPYWQKRFLDTVSLLP